MIAFKRVLGSGETNFIGLSNWCKSGDPDTDAVYDDLKLLMLL